MTSHIENLQSLLIIMDVTGWIGIGSRDVILHPLGRGRPNSN